jgi:hypothetical protein
MRFFPLFALFGCSAVDLDTAVRDTDTDTDTDSGVGNACAYPEGAVEPMTVGSVLTPYSWPEAIDRRSGARVALDLANVPCDVDEIIDWSPFDVLVFISLPAW